MTTRRLLCLVTDRRRLAASLGSREAEAIPPLLLQIEGAVRGGIDLVQIREHDLEGAALARLVRDALRIAAGSATRVMVNERVDITLATGAHGVHLRESSVPASVVRQAWPALGIGRSVHSIASLGRAGGADYLIAGTTFPSDSKPDAECLGVEGLATIVQAARDVPVLAIGGVTVARVPLVIRAGALGMAAVAAFMPDPGARNIADTVEKTVKRVRFAIDTASTVS